MPTERLSPAFSADSRVVLSTKEIPTLVEVDPIAGEKAIHKLDDLRERREQEVAFRIAKLTLDRYFRDADGGERPWLFPQLIGIVHRWMAECVECHDNAFPQMLLLSELQYDASDRVYRSIVMGTTGQKRLMPIPRSFDPVGTTAHVAFDTTKDVFTTSPDKCHLNYVPLDSNWEAKLAQTLEAMPEVISYAKNQALNFSIPYTFEGSPANYFPDYIIRVKDDDVAELNLVLEVSGEAKKAKGAKVATAETLWVPAVNNSHEYGRWSFLEVTDPWNAANLLRQHLARVRAPRLVEA
jgi:type III restriction enzyme